MGKYYFKSERVGVNIKGMGFVGKEHVKVQKELVRFIYDKLSKVMNYDHVRMTVPKYPVPFKRGRRRYDISFFMNDTVVMIQIDTFKPLKPLRTLLREYAKS